MASCSSNNNSSGSVKSFYGQGQSVSFLQGVTSFKSAYEIVMSSLSYNFSSFKSEMASIDNEDSTTTNVSGAIISASKETENYSSTKKVDVSTQAFENVASEYSTTRTQSTGAEEYKESLSKSNTKEYVEGSTSYKTNEITREYTMGTIVGYNFMTNYYSTLSTSINSIGLNSFYSYLAAMPSIYGEYECKAYVASFFGIDIYTTDYTLNIYQNNNIFTVSGTKHSSTQYSALLLTSEDISFKYQAILNSNEIGGISNKQTTGTTTTYSAYGNISSKKTYNETYSASGIVSFGTVSVNKPNLSEYTYIIA